jgi:WD40 repeat protein
MKHLIITVHGIRTFGHWQERLERLIRSECKSESDKDVTVFNYKYGYFSILAFLTPPIRWLVVRRFRQEFQRRSMQRDWDRIDIVAHSFGTHLVAWGIYGIPKRHRPKVHTIILAGNVLKHGFPWGEMADSCVHRVVNDCGIHDRVLLLNQLIVLFTGMAGRTGFTGMTGTSLRNRFFAFGHSGYFLGPAGPNDKFLVDKWLPLLTRDSEIELFDDPRRNSAVSGLVSVFLNNLEPIKLLFYSLPLVALFLFYRSLYVTAASERTQAEIARAEAIESAEQTRNRASKAESDIALRLADEGSEDYAYSHAVRALELNVHNDMAQLVAYRLLTDGVLVIPTHLIAHSSVVRAAVFSADGRFFATGCDDGSIAVIELDTGKAFTLGEKLRASVKDIAFSPDGQAVAVATGSEAGEKPAVRIWRYQSSIKPTLLWDKFFWDDLELAWPSSDRVVVHSGRNWGSGGRMTIVFGLIRDKPEFLFGVGDLFENEGEFQLSPQEMKRFVNVQPIETWVVAAMGLLVVHDKENNRLLWLDLHNRLNITQPRWMVKTTRGDIVDVGTKTGVALIGTHYTDRVRLQWRRLEGGGEINGKRSTGMRWADPRSKTESKIPLDADVAVDRITPDGEKILCLTSTAAQILNRKNGRQLSAVPIDINSADDLLSSDEYANCLVFSAVENHLDIRDNIDSSVIKRTLCLPGTILGAKLDPTNQWLAVYSDDMNVRIWRRTALKREALSVSMADPGVRSRFLLNSKSNYSIKPGKQKGWEIYRFDSHKEQEIYVSTLQPSADGYGGDSESVPQITGYDFSPNGAHVAVTYGSWSSRPDNNDPAPAIVYETANGHIVGKPLRHENSAFSPRYATNGKWFVTASNDRSIRCWDSMTLMPLKQPLRLSEANEFVQVSPDNRLLVTGNGDIIDVDQWRVIKKLSAKLVPLDAVFFSPNGQWIATVSESSSRTDQEPKQEFVQLNQWDMQNGVQIGDSINVQLADDDESERYNWDKFPGCWVDPGKSIVIGKSKVWTCAPPFDIGSILPFLREAQSVILTDNGEVFPNTHYALDSLPLAKFFPNGKTAENARLYDFISDLLKRN